MILRDFQQQSTKIRALNIKLTIFSCPYGLIVDWIEPDQLPVTVWSVISEKMQANEKSDTSFYIIWMSAILQKDPL